MAQTFNTRVVTSCTPVERPRLVSVIVNWNNYEHTYAFLASFARVNTSDHEIIVVDNHSPNKSTERIQEEFPQCTYFYNDANVGIAPANNVAIKYAQDRGADYVFLFNNDLEIIESDFFEKMVQYMDSHPKVAMAAPQLVYPDKRLQDSIKRIPTPANQIAELLRLPQKKTDLSPLKQHGDAIPSDYFVMASALLVRTVALQEIGFEDERFVLGYEDIDWVKRVHESSGEVHFVPGATIVHHHGVSSKNTMRNVDFYYGEKLRFLMKHYSYAAVLVFRFVVFLSSIARALVGKHARSHLYLAYRIWTYPWTQRRNLIPYKLAQSV